MEAPCFDYIYSYKVQLCLNQVMENLWMNSTLFNPTLKQPLKNE